MGPRGAIAVVAGIALIALALAQAALGGADRVFPVSLKITADAAAQRLDGVIETDAPGGFCDSSKIRVKKVVPGKDEVIARVKPHDAKWHLAIKPEWSGARLYAAVSRYALPSRPVECLAARSNTVTAP